MTDVAQAAGGGVAWDKFPTEKMTDLASLPVDEHVGVFEDVQRRLHDTLADLTGR